ncbi:MAG: VWA domain-containing protein [Cyanobacteria bacterium P01_A01_bin.123]
MIQPSFKAPMIQLTPLHGAIAANQATTLDVLIKIVPPDAPEFLPERPPINLGLVIDRSGSMGGAKISYAKEAACYAVEQLLPGDRVSVTLFDTHVKTIVPSTPATQKVKIIEAIRQVRVGSSTALHAGWVEGGMQVGYHLSAEQLNRVILLSDGLANVGETNPDAIANDVHGLTRRGISTTTLGVGNDYSEDLLEAMARSGDGNFYHIESPQQLPDIFQTELQGLVATVGHTVSLGLEPRLGVSVIDVLNDFDITPTGRYQLPNLVMGSSIQAVVRLRVPAQRQLSSLCDVRLAWDAPGQPERQIMRTALQMPVVPVGQLGDYPADPEVQQQVAMLMAARARKEAIAKADTGDLAGASAVLIQANQCVAAAPQSSALSQESAMLRDLSQGFSAGKVSSTRKKARSQHFSRHNKQSS